MELASATLPPFDDRGVHVASIRISITARAEHGAWRDLLAKLPRSLNPIGAMPGPTAASFVALPQVFGEHAHFFEAHMSVIEPDSQVAEWDLALLDMPSTVPPRMFVEASDRLGGYPGVLELLAQAWPAEPPSIAKHTVTYLASPKAWSGVKGAPRPKDVRLPRRTFKLRPRQTSWAVDPPRACIAGVAQTWGPPNLVVVAASGGLSVTVSGTMFKEVERATWEDLKELLQKAR
jgi:hypothetical protein